MSANHSIRRFFVGAVVAMSGIGIGSAVHAADLTVPTDAPPPPTRPLGDLAVEPTDEESTTCGGTISCRILENACLLAGGTYSGWDSKTPGHNHPHGVCTWPWE